MKKYITASLFASVLVISVFFGSFGSFAQMWNSDDVVRPSPMFEYSLALAIQDLEKSPNRISKENLAIQVSGKPKEFEKFPKTQIAQITIHTCFTCFGDHTCMGSPTCLGTPTCVGGPTCAGSTCAGSATCGGTTCTTCAGMPTCAGSSTCMGGPTCSGSSTCAGTQTCSCSDGKIVPLLPLLLDD